ncbi:hypothetical protein UlMin_030862 [Ulmus minor]
MIGIHLPEVILHAKQMIHRRCSTKHRLSFNSSRTHDHDHRRNVPKGHFAIYVGEGEEKTRFVVPISYLKHPSFQALLYKAAEEFGFDHQMGAITIPCAEQDFINVTSSLNAM